MAITIVVENGSGSNPNANSYIDVAFATQFASDRGESFPTDQDAVASLIIQGMDYVESLRSRFPGTKTSATQPLAWPRSGTKIDCADFPDNAIPVELKKAVAQLAIDAYALGDLNPATDTFAVSREKVDVLEIQYATGGQASSSSSQLPESPRLPKAQAWLDFLLYPCGKPGFVTTVRV